MWYDQHCRIECEIFVFSSCMLGTLDFTVSEPWVPLNFLRAQPCRREKGKTILNFFFTLKLTELVFVFSLHCFLGFGHDEQKE